METFITLCLIMHWYSPPQHFSWCRKELRQAHVRVTTQPVCLPEYSSETYINEVNNAGYAGSATVGSYGKYKGEVNVYRYTPLINYLGETINLNRKQLRTRLNNTLCHEIGHNLGLMHSHNPRSIMFYGYIINAKRRQRFLNSDKRILNEKYFEGKFNLKNKGA